MIQRVFREGSAVDTANYVEFHILTPPPPSRSYMCLPQLGLIDMSDLMPVTPTPEDPLSRFYTLKIQISTLVILALLLLKNSRPTENTLS